MRLLRLRFGLRLVNHFLHFLETIVCITAQLLDSLLEIGELLLDLCGCLLLLIFLRDVLALWGRLGLLGLGLQRLHVNL